MLPDIKNTVPNKNIPVITIITIKRIDKKRGQRILSRAIISGNITNASNTAITKGSITEEAIFKTAPPIIQQIKTIRKKIALPELKFRKTLFILTIYNNYKELGNLLT